MIELPKQVQELLQKEKPTHKCAECGRLMTDETVLENCPAKQDGHDDLPGCTWAPVASQPEGGEKCGKEN